MLSILLSGCDKWPTNGDIDGMWQVMEISREDKIEDVKDMKLYCSFQLRLFCLGDIQKTQRIFGYTEYGSNTIRFHTFTYRSEYTEDNNVDVLLEDNNPNDLETIQKWGFNSTDCTFKIEELNSSRMVLSNNGTKITYRKI